MKDTFDFSLPDSQATAVEPIKPEKFDLEAYQAYEQELLTRCKNFWKSDSGVLVYRRMRVQEVFSYDSKDMKKSLEWQLGALWKSMAFRADVPNFLEPWYGLGTIASTFGFDYVWNEGQAPAINGHFDSVEQLLNYDAKPVETTPIGKHTLDMIDYFLTRTREKLPISYSDVQSPLNIVANMVDSNQFYMDFILNPELIHQAFDRTAALFVDYMKIQQRMIGDALAKPGHGFASSRCFDGMGMSDDNIVMLSNEMYNEFAVPALIKACAPFGGGVFHSCGDWSGKKEDIVKIDGIRMADGAFSKATDPNANPTDGFADTFAGTGVVLNARIVGTPDVVEEKVRELWKPGMKLIVATYCDTPEEQSRVYQKIHEICR
ncbi:MAG: uroporphyrinogen decarboxylase family protein [Bacteroides sp.]|nr:uroporphyrinogen decarboxylase family protein [Bacteroides sp.]